MDTYLKYLSETVLAEEKVVCTGHFRAVMAFDTC